MSVEAALADYEAVDDDPALLPQVFSDRYRRMSVRKSNGSTTRVDVHKYRINREYSGRPDPDLRIIHRVATNERAEVARPLQRWCDRNGATGRRLREIAFTERKLNFVFNGKARPRDIALILAAINATGRLDDKYPDRSLNEAARIQKYCDEHIGVDCSGLVNAFFNARGHYGDTPANHNVTISTYKRLENRIDLLDPDDDPWPLIICWKDTGHIALVDRRVRRGKSLRVIESSASLGGIRATEYAILDEPNLRFARSRRFWVMDRKVTVREERMNVYVTAPLASR